MKMKFTQLLNRIINDESGAASVEYAMLAMAIAAVIIVAVGMFGMAVYDLFALVPDF